MKKIYLIAFCCLPVILQAQSAAKTAYAEIGGPGLASANYDMRFANTEDGLGFRVGIGGFSLGNGIERVSILTLPVGFNYLLGADRKNYLELGAGFTYIRAKSEGDVISGDFRSSFGNLTLGYRLAPAKGGFMFKAQITPVFGSRFFVPFYGGVGFGYKFN